MLLNGKGQQLGDESVARLHHWSFLPKFSEGLFEAPLIQLHEVVGDYGGATRHASYAVDQHIGALALLVDELIAIGKDLPDVLPIIVLDFIETAHYRWLVAIMF